MMVYIAADSPLPLIEWQENVTAFCVTELTQDEKRVSKQFSKPFLAYAGSYGGCSCGFSYGEVPVEDDDDAREDALARESVRQLSQYLSPLVKNGSIEIFACWDGDQEVGPEERLSVSPDYFGGGAFAFKEKQFLVVDRVRMSLRATFEVEGRERHSAALVVLRVTRRKLAVPASRGIITMACSGRATSMSLMQGLSLAAVRARH